MPDLPIQFEVHPSSGVPIYRQIMEQVLALVAGNHLKPGEMVPSVRQMAAELEINMMTVSKAYTKLETDGVLERVRGTGMRVCKNDVNGSVAERSCELRPHTEAMVTRGKQLGLKDEQIISVVKSVLKERRQ